MRSKLIQIKDLKVGDQIKTYHNNEVSFRPVVDIWNTEVQTEDRYVIEFTNGTKIRCSRNHPIMILTDVGVEQCLPLDITEFDEVITDSGSCYLYSITKDVEDIEYIDIEVEDTHTFFTAAAKDDQMILTHNSQGGVRGGAATLYYPIWHLEVEDLLVLKNNKGTEDTRVRHMDYGVQFNKLMYERLLTGGDITLFSPNDVPGLYDAFFNDQDRFRELYETAERNTRIRKKKVKAIDLFSSFISERKDTGRIYLQNVDHSNTHSSFDEKKWPVKQSNLCAEITLSTKPLNDINDEEGRIALCTLSAINWGNIKDPKDFEKPCTLAIRGLDALLSYQNYPVKAAELSTYDFRPLGVGIINLAYFLAKNDVSYTDPAALALVDKYAEVWSYYLIKASADLAAEQGACGLSEDTKYARGIVPCDTRKIEIDELVPHQERMPWNELREQLKETGIRNATVMALMPAECQSLNNELLLKSNQTIRLDDLIKTAGIDVDSIHEQQMVGQRFSFQKPIELLDSIAYECYYNGPQSVTEIEFEDGNVYRFTENHKLLVNRGEQEIWVSVSELNETDEIVGNSAKIKISRNVAVEHTWDISTDTETYRLSNGVMSHNTSAQIANATNGIEPPRAYVSVKQSKHGILKQVVPGYPRLKNKYELLWDQKSPEGYLKICAVLQKWIDQSISTNTSYNPTFYEDDKIPMSEMLKHLVLCYKYGIKTLYYFNTADGAGELDIDKLGGKKMELEPAETDDSDCDSCVI